MRLEHKMNNLKLEKKIQCRTFSLVAPKHFSTHPVLVLSQNFLQGLFLKTRHLKIQIRLI